MAIIVSFLAGGCIVLSRTINALLSNHIGPYQSTLVNNVVGTFAAIIFFALSSEWVTTQSSTLWSAPWYVYLGGLLGIGVVYLSNITTLKIPAFLLTLIIFIAQMATGFVLDLTMGKQINVMSFVGVLLILLGLVVQMGIEQKNKKASE